MQYPITHTCGHTETHHLYGSYADRERKAVWLKTVPCLACKRDSERDAAAAAMSDLPALTGTDKQIAWATTIRADIISRIDDVVAKGEAAGGVLPQDLAAKIAAVKGQASASWWIDHRASTLAQVLS